METEATNVSGMKDRRRVIMMITRGAISQRGIKRTPDADRSQIRPINSRKTTRPFLRKHKAKVNNETRQQTTKSPTLQDGDSRRQKKGISVRGVYS